MVQKLEPVLAFLLGALIRLKSGKTFRLPSFRTERRALDPSLFGFDFSKWQGAIDFSKVFAYGTRFVILRCSYATTTDERFLQNIQNCLRYFPDVTSVYHYYDPTVSPTRQADKVIELISPYKEGIRRVWGDFEFYWQGAYEGSAYWKIFAERIVAAGYKFGVYTRATWWDGRIGNLSSWFGQFPLWAAQYNVVLNLIPKGWTRADIWQSGTPSIGKMVGTESLEVDYDIMDSDFYRNEYGGELPTGGEMTKYEVTAGGLWLRSAPAISESTQIIVMPQRTLVWGIVESGWIKVSHYQLPGEQYATARDGYCSGNSLYIKQVPFTDPPLPVPPGTKSVTVTVELDGYKPWTVTGTLESE